MATRAAQDCWRIEFCARPNFRIVSGKLGMTFMTREPVAAALELDRDDIGLTVIMSTSRLRIDIHAQDDYVVNFHDRSLNFFARAD